MRRGPGYGGGCWRAGRTYRSGRRRWECGPGSDLPVAGQPRGFATELVRAVEEVPCVLNGDSAELRDRHPSATDLPVRSRPKLDRGDAEGSGGLRALAQVCRAESGPDRGIEVDRELAAFASLYGWAVKHGDVQRSPLAMKQMVGRDGAVDHPGFVGGREFCEDPVAQFRRPGGC